MLEKIMNRIRLLLNPIIKFFSYKRKSENDVENQMDEEILFINKDSYNLNDFSE